MYYVKNERNGQEITDAATNLAIEYYLLNEVVLDEPILLFYINHNAIIVGKNQNAYEEINTEYVEKNHIQVVRRFSGGGAVYHDKGTLNFCFITADDGQSFRDFKKFTAPVIEVLHELGAKEAELQGRNDLVIKERKFSGNAMYAKNGRLTAHGTLLYDSDLEAVTGALRPKKHKLESKGIKSVRSRVTNIKPHLSEQYQSFTTQDFRKQLLMGLFGTTSTDSIKQYELKDEDWEKIDQFKEQYTGNWDWNYGKSPKFDLERSDRLSVGTVEAKLNVQDGRISKIKLYGDFFGMGEITDVESVLTGVVYSKKAIGEALAQIDLMYYFGGKILSELTELIY